RIVPGARDLELATIVHARLTRAYVGLGDGLLVVVEARERRGGERLCHQDRRGAVTASDVGHASTGLELSLNAVECRNPGLHEVPNVARAEEAIDAAEYAVIVLMPADALARAKR